MALGAPSTKGVERLYIGEPSEKKRKVIELAGKLAKTIAEKMKQNKAPTAIAPNAPSGKVKKLHLKDRTAKKVLSKIL